MKAFSVKQTQVTSAIAGLAAASITDTAGFVPAGQLLKTIQQASSGLKKDIMAHTLRIVAGHPCATVLPVLTNLRAAMKDAKAAGDSSVGTVRAAVAALAAKHGGDFPVPVWATAKEAREAQAAAEAVPVDPNAPPQAEAPTAEEVNARLTAEVEELRAIAAEVRRALALAPDATNADVLAELATMEAQEVAPAE